MMNFTEVPKAISEVSKKSMDMPKFGEGVSSNNIKDFNEADKKLNIEKNNIDKEISNSISENLDCKGIDKLRDNYINIDKKLSEISNDIKDSQGDLDLQRTMGRIARYKGTISECMLKDALKDKFEYIENSQRIVSTPYGDTKPDIVLSDSKQYFSIGDTIVNKGDDLYAEVKCGDANYIRSEMNHIEKQVSGHEGKSVVILTKDYYNINENKRLEFESKLAEKDSSVCVLDVNSKDIEKAIIDNVRR